MKHSNFALAILSAIILSACGSSSSNDNQSVDPTPSPTPNQNSNSNPTPTPTPAKPISPAANPNPESIPQQQSSSNANNNQPISSQTTPIVKAKPNPKTAGGSKQKQNKGQGQNTQTPSNGKLPVPEKANFSKTPEAAEKDHLAAVEEKAKADTRLQEVTKVANDAVHKATATKGALTTAASKVQAAALALKNAKDATPPEPAKIAEAQIKLDAANDALKTAQEENRAALENRTKALVDKVTAEKQVKIAQSNVDTAAAVTKAVKAKESEPKAVVDSLEAAANFAEAQAAQAATEAAVVIANTESANIDKEINELKFAISKNEDVVKDSNVSPEDKAIAKAAIDADTKKIKELEDNKKEVADKLNDAKIKHAAAQKATSIASLKASSAEGDAAHRGVYGSDGSYSSSSFQAVEKVENTGSKWTLTLKGVDKPLVIDTSAITTQLGSAPKYGYFKKDDDKVTAYNKANGATKSIYGYTDEGKFFSVGKVASETDAAAFSGIFIGAAFLTTQEGGKTKNLVSDVEANIAGKTLTGKFFGFQSYTNGDATLGNYMPFAGKKFLFTSEIQGNKFVPAQGFDDQAKAYGYFYGDTSSPELGGLVKHKNFEGSFGAKQ